MDGIPVSQQTASNSNISTEAVQGTSEGQFGTRRTSKLYSSVRKKIEHTGSKLKTAFSTVQRSVKNSHQLSDDIWFNLLDTKGYLDSESAESFYQDRINAFSKCYEDALKAYVAEKPNMHFPYLKGYLEDKPRWYSFSVEERGEGGLFVTISTMPGSFRNFSEQLVDLLHGHGKSGSLAKYLKESFQSLGVAFDTVDEKVWLVRLKPLDPLKIQPGMAIEGLNRSSSCQFARSDNDEKEKRRLIDEIKVLYQINEESFGFCKISKQIADFHKCYVRGWEEPAGLPDYLLCQAIGANDDNLEKLGKDMLLAVKSAHISKNQSLSTYINLTWQSFPSSQNGRQPIKISEDYTISQIMAEALRILERPEQRRFESIKQRLFSSRYEREARGRNSLQAALLQLKAAGDSLKGYKNYEKAAETSAWFMNLVGECLRQGMPEASFKLGKITISSGFRKIWKEQLMEWNIERSDKISPTPNIESDSANETRGQSWRRLR